MPKYTKPYKLENIQPLHGKTRGIAVCPFCGEQSTIYVWSLRGSGKRCKCGAKFRLQTVQGYFSEKEIETNPPAETVPVDRFKIYFKTFNPKNKRYGSERHKVIEAENSAKATSYFWQWIKTLKNSNAEIIKITKLRKNEETTNQTNEDQS